MENNIGYELYWVTYIGYYNGKQITTGIQYKVYPGDKLDPDTILSTLKRNIPLNNPKFIISWSKMNTIGINYIETVEQG